MTEIIYHRFAGFANRFIKNSELFFQKKRNRHYAKNNRSLTRNRHGPPTGGGMAPVSGHTRLRAGTSPAPTRSRSSCSGAPLKTPVSESGFDPNSAYAALPAAFRPDGQSRGCACAADRSAAFPLPLASYDQSASMPESFILAASSSRVSRAKNSRAWRLINPRRSPKSAQRARHLPFRKKQ